MSRRFRSLSHAAKRLRVLPWIWLLISFPAIGTTLVTIISASRSGLSQDTAAWAQAAGSIIAIASAIWIAERENVRRRREKTESRKEAVFDIRYALAAAANEAAVVYHDFKDFGHLMDRARFEDWSTQCKNAHALLDYAERHPDHLHPGFVQEATNGQLILEQLQRELDRFVANGNTDDTSLAATATRIESCAGNLAFLRDRVDQRMSYYRDEPGFWSRSELTKPPEDKGEEQS